MKGSLGTELWYHMSRSMDGNKGQVRIVASHFPTKLYPGFVDNEIGSVRNGLFL